MKKFLACFLMFCIGIMSNAWAVGEHLSSSWAGLNPFGYMIPTVSIIGIRIALMLILVILLVLLFIELYKNNKYHVHLSKKIILFALCIIMSTITRTIIFVKSIELEFVSIDDERLYTPIILRVFDFTEW